MKSKDQRQNTQTHLNLDHSSLKIPSSPVLPHHSNKSSGHNLVLLGLSWVNIYIYIFSIYFAFQYTVLKGDVR